MLCQFVPSFVAVLLLAACSSAPISQPSIGASPTANPTFTGAPTPSETPSTTADEGTQQPPTPTQAADSDLLARIRADVRATDCQQIQGDLPPGLVEVVVCDVGSQLVDNVTVARYSNLDALMAFYEARLAEFGIALATDVGPPGQTPEDCWRGHASESFYWPAGAGPDMNREGCFVDQDRDANQLELWGGPLVLITVEGSTADIAELKAWTWEGGEPALGGPGVWQPPPA